MSVPGFMYVRPPRGESNLIRRSVSNTAAGGSAFASMLPAQNGGTAPAALPLTPDKTQGMHTDKTTNVDAEVQRANTLAKVDLDKRRAEALNAMTQNFVHPGNPFSIASNMTTVRNLRSVFGGFALRMPDIPMSGSIKSKALQQAQRQQGKTTTPHNAAQPSTPQATTGTIGKLAARFESGKAGIAAIGYDKHGGTSYGKYQIASRVGSMDTFLNFLDTNAPDIAKTLRDAGPANTGSREGAMPDVWKRIAAEQPDRFEALQEKFIYDSHYRPALQGILAKTSIKESQLSGAMQEVLWSTAVQHGPSGAVRIFRQAVENITDDTTGENFYSKLINNIYDIRAGQFGSSTEQVQRSVRNRMQEEKSLALTMLNDTTPQA